MGSKLIIELKTRIYSNPKKFFAISFLLLALWQIFFFWQPDRLNKNDLRKDATGMGYTYARKFVFFYYHMGLFPLVSEKEPTEGSYQEASNILKEGGNNLLMEYFHWSRLGDSGRIFMFMPDAFLFGKIKEPSVRTFNAIFFTLSLFSVLVAFYLHKRFIMGICYVLLIGSSSFWLYETYVHENIFAVLIFNFNFLLALFLNLILDKSQKYILLKMLLAGLTIAFFSSIRAEVKSMLLSGFLVIFLYKHSRWYTKILWMLVLVASFKLCSVCINLYFDYKFNEAYQIVKKNRGIPYDGPRIQSHKLWHPIFVFLGDFDTKYGYGPKVNDTVAYSYAVPVLNEKYGMNIKYSGKLYLDDYYDSTKKYYKKFDEIPEYEQVCKEKVLSDIKKDPWWFSEIILKRIVMNITCLSPLSLRFLTLNIPIPFSGIWALLLVPAVIYFKEFSYLKFLLFSIPISLVSILIYSKDNITYNHVYHTMALVVIIQITTAYLLKRHQKQV